MSWAYRNLCTAWQRHGPLAGGMPPGPAAPTAARRTRSTVLLAALAVVGAVLFGVPVHLSLTSSSSSAAPPIDAPQGDPVPTIGGIEVEDGGAVPDGVTVFDDRFAAVARLDPALLGALRRAATDAAADGVELVVNSGWRSAAYQERLFQQAVAEHGSEEEAARWVATPETSAHVSGDAVDIGPSKATAWLSHHGADYGLCRTYRNEPWHFELRPQAVRHACPRPYEDPTHDPRMQK
jgi:D-alanyl-D-alanine carboxypeptidase